MSESDVSIKEYFEQRIPEIFTEQVANSPVMGMADTVARVQFDITSKDGAKHTYSVTIKDAKELEVVPGPVSEAMVRVLLSEGDWREAVTGELSGAADMFTDMKQMANRGRYDQLKELKGKLLIALSRAGKENVDMEIVFNGAQTPASTFKCALEDWAKMSKGELSGMSAFMEGKLKIEGDMAFALSLSALVS